MSQKDGQKIRTIHVILLIKADSIIMVMVMLTKADSIIICLNKHATHISRTPMRTTKTANPERTQRQKSIHWD